MDRFVFRILLSSLAIIFFASLAISILNLLYTSHLVRTLSIDEFKEVLENPPLISKIIGWVSTLVQFFVYFLAGWFAGFKMRKSGVFYGGLVGVIWVLLGYIVVLSYSLVIIFLPNSYLSTYPEGSEKIKQEQINSITKTFTANIPYKLMLAFMVIGLTTLGGIVAEKKLIRKKLKRSKH